MIHMTGPMKILMLEDNVTDAVIIQQVLKKEIPDCEFKMVNNKEGYGKELERFQPDVILSNHSIAGLKAGEALKMMQDLLLNIPFILVTDAVSDEYAASIIKSGADDYILKTRLSGLPAAIGAAVKQRKSNKEIIDYKYALDQSSIISITDQKGIIKYANENFCKISKYSAGELIGQDHRIINSGFHPKPYIKNLWTTIAKGNIWRGEFCNRAKDGSLYWVEATIVPFCNKRGKPYQYLAIRVDITQRKHMEQALQTARDRIFFHVENSPLAFIEWDNQIRPKTWSSRAQKIFGWTEQEALSDQLDWFSKVYEKDLPWVSKILQQLASGKLEKKQVQHRNYTKDNRVIWCDWFNSVVRDMDGNVITILSLVQDITDKKNAENEILEMNEQLRKLSKHLQHIREEERTHMAREIHDQLGQQLTVMKMDISWLNKKLESGESQVKDKIRDMKNVLDDTIKLVRKIAADLRPSLLDDMGLDAAIEWNLGEFEKRSGIKSAVKKTGKALPLPDDVKTGMFRIVQESLTNVARYSEAKNVTVSLQHKNKEIIMTIQDDGVGFDHKEIAAKKTFGLLGMKERTVMMGGQFEISSSPGNGTTVSLKIPLQILQ